MSKTIHSQAQLALRDELVEARRAQNLSQQDLAKKLFCHQSMVVARIESGERRIDVVELVVLCRAIGIAPDEIVKLIEKKVAPDHRL